MEEHLVYIGKDKEKHEIYVEKRFFKKDSIKAQKAKLEYTQLKLIAYYLDFDIIDVTDLLNSIDFSKYKGKNLIK